MSVEGERKTIQFNPELFKLPDGKTRKKRPVDKKIKFKETKQPVAKNKSVKTKLLKYIREKQEENYKRMFDETTNRCQPSKYAVDYADKHNNYDDDDDYDDSDDDIAPNEKTNDFNETVHFFHELSKEQSSPPPPKQQQQIPTEKNPLIITAVNEPLVFQRPAPQHPTTPPLRNTTMKQQQLTMRNNNDYFAPLQPSLRQNACVIPPPPNYGCLKNGNLPTYRTFMNKTLNNHNNQYYSNNNKNTNNNIQSSSQLFVSQQQQQRQKMLEMREVQNKMMNMKREPPPKQIPKFIKRKKTLRRTFHLGKSKHHPKVSVLIPNKTVRNRISTHSQLLKQTPTETIKQYLVRNGFIRVGSTAPDDVLRKMYESAMMIGGEIKNHNPENLLYNYLNSTDGFH